MSGFGDNEVILFPGRVVAIRAANVAKVPQGEKARSDDAEATPRAVDRSPLSRPAGTPNEQIPATT